MNPAVFAVLTGFGLVVKGVVSFKQCGKKAKKAELVRIAYKKILDAMRFLLRGDPFNEKYFLDKLRMINDFISNHYMDIPEQICTKYSLHFTTGAQNSTTHRIFVLPGDVSLEKCCREGKTAGDEYLFFQPQFSGNSLKKIGQKTNIVDRFLPGA